MRIIISPAKKMKTDRDSLAVRGMPCFLAETKRLMEEVGKLSFEEAKALWKCNDKLAELNYERFARMEPERCLTPALLSYEGLQYQYMAPGVFTEEALSYLSECLRILSGFYGLLKSFDGVVPYRLEMQAKLSVQGCRDLYDFWGGRLYEGLRARNKRQPKGDRVVINLASKEYSRCIEKYVTGEDRFITVEFGQVIGGKVIQKGTLAKIARGEMVRYLAEQGITDPKGLKDFCQLGFAYSKELSGEDRYVFLAG